MLGGMAQPKGRSGNNDPVKKESATLDNRQELYTIIQRYNDTIMEKLTIDPRSDTPIYQQIVDQIRYMITTGALQPGDQLPTVRTVAQETRINFNTVSRAYRILDQDGIISTQQGRGTYITEAAIENESIAMKAEVFIDLTRELIKKGKQLGFTLDEIMRMIQEERTNERTQE